MRSPARQTLEQPVEYATKADFQVLAAELRALRETMEARFDKVEGLLESQHELIRMLSSRIDQVNARIDQADARLDRTDARRDSLLKWGMGVLAAAVIGFGGMILGAARLIIAAGGDG